MNTDNIVADGLHRDRKANGNLEIRNAELRRQLEQLWEEKVDSASWLLKPYLRFRMRLELERFDSDEQNLYVSKAIQP